MNNAADTSRKERRRAERALRLWPEIARYAGRSVRSVQRWEEFYHFPVRRDEHGVFAHPREIDEWMARPLSFRTELDLQANRRWNTDLRKDAEEAMLRSRVLRKQAQHERQGAQRWHKRA
jgi:hypothetical protein